MAQDSIGSDERQQLRSERPLEIFVREVLYEQRWNRVQAQHMPDHSDQSNLRGL